jgi:hypothetical protein
VRSISRLYIATRVIIPKPTPWRNRVRYTRYDLVGIRPPTFLVVDTEKAPIKAFSDQMGSDCANSLSLSLSLSLCLSLSSSRIRDFINFMMRGHIEKRRAIKGIQMEQQRFTLASSVKNGTSMMPRVTTISRLRNAGHMCSSEGISCPERSFLRRLITAYFVYVRRGGCWGRDRVMLVF